MTSTEIQIIDLLKQGLSYAQIQEKLQVSSKTIAAIKKANYILSGDSNYVQNIDTFPQSLNPTTSEAQNFLDASTNTITIADNSTTNKKTNPMTTDDKDSDDKLSTTLEIEKYRIRLAHDLELEKLKITKEENDRAHSLREEELEIRRYEVINNTNKSISGKQTLLSRIKEIAGSCGDNVFSFDAASMFLQKTWNLLSDCEQYCHANGITFHGTVSHTLLTTLIKILNDFLEDLEEDESDDLEFDSAFRRLLSRTTFQSF
jgi:hypothetical protein